MCVFNFKKKWVATTIISTIILKYRIIQNKHAHIYVYIKILKISIENMSFSIQIKLYLIYYKENAALTKELLLSRV